MRTVIFSSGYDKEWTCQEGKSTLCAMLLPVHQFLCGLSSGCLPVTWPLPPTRAVLPTVTGRHWTELLISNSLRIPWQGWFWPSSSSPMVWNETLGGHWGLVHGRYSLSPCKFCRLGSGAYVDGELGGSGFWERICWEKSLYRLAWETYRGDIWLLGFITWGKHWRLWTWGSDKIHFVFGGSNSIDN